MKRLVVAANLVLLVIGSAVPAQATGIALRWLSCAGSANRNFACDRSTGSEILVGSFEPPAGINQFVGIEGSVRVVSATNTLPAWWQFKNTGSCRQTSLSLNFDVSDQMECDDPWLGQATGGIGRYLLDGNSGELLFVAAMPPSAAHSITPGTTYAAFKLVVNHQRTTGGGACAGCDSPVCIRFVSIKLVMPSRSMGGGGGSGTINQQQTQSQYVEITQGISGMGGSSNIATWQGGAASCSQGGSKPASWKQLKDLYRTR